MVSSSVDLNAFIRWCGSLLIKPTVSDNPYTPGKYVRTVRQARAERKEQQKNNSKTPRAVFFFGIAIVIIVAYMLVPRIVNMIAMAGKKSNPMVEQAEMENEVFNPYAPIIIVPNDYNTEE